MSQTILRVEYRPVRLSFCIEYDDLAAFRSAVSHSFKFWGGVHNPIIVIGGNSNPQDVATRYRVDAFYPLSSNPKVTEFVERNNKDAWPFFLQELFIGSECVPAVLDSMHAMYDIREFVSSKYPKMLPIWAEDDPLKDVFACLWGQYPDASGDQIDFGRAYEGILSAQRIGISKDKSFPEILRPSFNPRRVSSFKLGTERACNFFTDPALRMSGIFCGKCDDFDDLVAFWNLLAANVNAIFYDERHGQEFACWKDWFVGREVVWFAQPNLEINSTSATWSNGMLQRSVSELHPHVLGLKKQTINANMTESNGIQLQAILPKFPHREELLELRPQHLAVTIESNLGFFDNRDYTLFTPGIPELSEFVGKHSLGSRWKSCRIHTYGTDIIQAAIDDVLIVKPIKKNEIVKQTLLAFGINSRESKPGLIANRLIKQMGGTSLCRIFKIAGVRELIREYGAEKSFTKAVAFSKIGPHLNAYDFFLPGKADEKLTSQSVFDHLVDQSIFRVGLEFECPNCNLYFWRLLDSVKTHILCDFCGANFNVTKQLELKDCWKYRVSGLFSQHKDLQGAIPVSVTLQHVEACLGLSFESITSTALELASNNNSFTDCEADFLFFGKESADYNYLILGECKGNTKISLDSVSKLKAVADSISVDRLRTYILFSKFSSFTNQELKFFTHAHHPDYRRIILLSETELEKSTIYDTVSRSTGIPPSPQNVDEWAAISEMLYYKTSDHLDKLRCSNGRFRSG